MSLTTEQLVEILKKSYLKDSAKAFGKTLRDNWFDTDDNINHYGALRGLACQLTLPYYKDKIKEALNYLAASEAKEWEIGKLISAYLMMFCFHHGDYEQLEDIALDISKYSDRSVLNYLIWIYEDGNSYDEGTEEHDLTDLAVKLFEFYIRYSNYEILNNHDENWSLDNKDFLSLLDPTIQKGIKFVLKKNGGK